MSLGRARRRMMGMKENSQSQLAGAGRSQPRVFVVVAGKGGL